MKLLNRNGTLCHPQMATARPIVEGRFRLEEPKIKRFKRWYCRGAVCDAHDLKRAWKLFRQSFGRDVKREEVVQISRHKDHP